MRGGEINCHYINSSNNSYSVNRRNNSYYINRREDFRAGYGLRLSAETRRSKRVRREKLQEACFVLAEISEQSLETSRNLSDNVIKWRSKRRKSKYSCSRNQRQLSQSASGQRIVSDNRGAPCLLTPRSSVFNHTNKNNTNNNNNNAHTNDDNNSKDNKDNHKDVYTYIYIYREREREREM